MTDFYWLTDGFFFRLVPNNSQAETAWCQIAEVFEAGAVPRSAWPSVKSQLKEAAYSVRKARKTKPLTDKELDKMLSDLGVL